MILPKDPNIFKAFSYRRYEEGYWLNGEYVSGAYSDSTMVASIQPLSGEQILRLTGNDRIKKGISIWTDVALSTGKREGEGSQKPDDIYYGGEWYSLDTLDVWQHGIAHYKGIAYKLNDT